MESYGKLLNSTAGGLLLVAAMIMSFHLQAISRSPARHALRLACFKWTDARQQHLPSGWLMQQQQQEPAAQCPQQAHPQLDSAQSAVHAGLPARQARQHAAQRGLRLWTPAGCCAQGSASHCLPPPALHGQEQISASNKIHKDGEPGATVGEQCRAESYDSSSSVPSRAAASAREAGTDCKAGASWHAKAVKGHASLPAAETREAYAQRALPM